ncbi:MAG: hypothetical protein ACE37F_21095 [Nannocystaceae bacterium]|nr:hypothetical protein [bacterium]
MSSVSEKITPPSVRAWRRLEIPQGDPSQTEVSAEQLRSLAAPGEGPRVTITMPTHERGIDIRQDPVRLRSLLDEAQAALGSFGDDELAARKRLAPARSLLEDEQFWNHGGQGLCLLLGPSQFHAFKVPYPLEASVSVGDRWRVRPLLALTMADRFAVIAISRDSVGLFEGSRSHLEQRPLGDIPANMFAVVGGEAEEPSLQHRSVGHDGAAIFHGHGKGHDDRDFELKQFVRSVAEALPGALSDAKLPVVVAAVERTVAEFRRYAGDLQLAPHAIEGDPGGYSMESLHEAAWSRVQPLVVAERTGALNRLETGPTEGISSDLSDILRQAFRGGVESLLVSATTRAWGTYEPENDTLVMNDERQAGDQDLLDVAVQYVLQRGGRVLPVDESSLPGGSVAAAILRF